MTNQQQPDKFFREKLENFQRPAPAAAWDRIESNLKKNNTKVTGWWWKVAASFLLVATATYLLWPAKVADQPLSTIEKQEVLIPESKNSIDKKDSLATTPESLNPTEDHAKKAIFAEKKQTNKKNSIRKKQLKDRTSAHTLASSADPNSGVQPIAELSETIVAVSKKTEPVPATKIKLQFSAEETNKYLDENAVAQATSEEKKSSTLKRLLKKAGDLKTNQDPFGDLREKKNEILALNFKNEKRGQNK